MFRASSIAVTVGAISLVARVAAAQSCENHRPTEAEGSAGTSYGSAEVASYDSPSGAARIHYALTGVHAPPSAAADGETPDAVIAAATAADDALAKFAELGFEAPLGDEDSPCPDNGGSGAFDVYLVQFSAADGHTLRDHCTTDNRCASFVMVENNFGGGGYADTEEGLRTVVPHELFHAVQATYDAGLEPWWAEGSAQWAAKQVYPEIEDLERFLPEYFESPWRPLNVPPGGVVAGFLYATAIWPVFLEQRHGAPLIVSVFDELDSSTEDVLETTERVLSSQASTLAATFLEFATYNAATGERATPGQGYANAAEYPLVPLTPFEATPGATVSEVGSGLGVYYYSVTVAQPIELRLEADPTRMAAVMLSVAPDGTVDPASAQPLPATPEDDVVVVVAGQSLARTDAPFTLRAETPTAAESSAESGGCTLSSRPDTNGWGASALLVLALLGARRRTMKGRG
ncbi:MAG TPA: MXAN_6640 family putative metalloprotease [Polyangiaceae bacterium]|nr:MXAN_6640 family putative metalloprotease [Polyangiaceae bacterium]